MSESFFPEAPRARGRGWWRRFRLLLSWLVFGTGAGILLGGIAIHLWTQRSELRRIFREGKRTTCTIGKMRVSGGKSPTYYVRLRLDEMRGREIEREVDSSDYRAVREGEKTNLYYIQGVDIDGVAEIERGHREGIGSALVCSGLSLIALLATWIAVVRLTREMRLLRIGVELVSQGTGLEMRLSHAGQSRTILQRGGGTPIRVPARVGVSGQVVLALPDLSGYFFPDLRDVPVERLVRHETITPRLPAPVRPSSPEWKKWLKKKYRVFRIWCIILGLVILLQILISVLAASLGWAVAAATFLLFEGCLILAWMRRHWRDKVLWREGDEVHAILLGKTSNKGTMTCKFAYAYRDQEYRKSESGSEVDFVLWEVESPPGAPAITPRVIALVDPYAPKRSALVPRAIRHSLVSGDPSATVAS